MNINQLTSNINKFGGVMKQNRFSVMITPPAWSKSQEEVRLIQFFCDTAQLPGISFATTDTRYLGYGPTFKLPHSPIYSDVDTTIICDNDGYIINFFHNWAQNIININTNGAPSTSGYNGAKIYSVQYPSNYVTEINIIAYDEQDKEIIIYTLHDAYPLRIGQPGLDWSATNSILKMSVTFTYNSWTANTFKLNDQNLSNSISTFNPYARTLSGSLYDVSTLQYLSTDDIISRTITSLINSNGNYSNNLLNIFK